MPSLEELAEQHSSQLSSVLKSAVETISSEQEITFRLYVRQVLPLDGFVYWVNAEITSCDELCRLNIESPTRLKIKGSLHRQIVAIQDESVSRDVNNIIFTPLQKVDDFNIENPEAIYLGEYGGVQFAFSRMESRYQQSGIFHYRGMAILPTMRSQIIDCPEEISDERIISNSIPLWLAMKDFATVYPSYLVPQNLRPPYIAVDVRNSTPLQAAPVVYGGQRFQLVQDSVRLTLYGFTNRMALDYIDSVVRRALEGEEFGVTNMPIPVDAKSGQVEINALAKKKTVDFEVNYYQSTVRDISRQLIKKVIMNYEVK
ncbi:hypothetical protein AHS86_05920 [Salmonella enterica subsp. enterica]|uniref:hypothetical protein n=1 Tax=Salmonella enterica TaxID=28901 RepID=UPI000FAE454C|nr:hypothetical protein [Salmonella enterica subsp. enterica]EBD6267036.1 hypothetical protein [Salmonella enterica]EBV5179329.1 hypothetical protein [Salmonella enterica subsp. enterica serovar Carmel]EDW2657551.1 hypothetical protein [Salmonella enterica subsp. enterica serovar Havana]EGI5883743.1 hypothetical protein [Salmonella enterica subsp. enterica serovar Magwa]HCV7461313.1 hypothetical protein [Salmonella enterica subsp. enterica serovar Bovismorbificans]